MAERFFDINVFAGGNGVEHHLSVPVLGCGDENDLNVLIGEEIFVVSVSFGMRTVCGSLQERPFQVGLIYVADSADPDLSVFLERSHDRRATAAAANDTEDDLVGRLGMSGYNEAGACE